MMASLMTVLLGLGAIGSGLVAGVFLAFSGFVMTALARLPAPQGIAAMQAINVTVLRSAFMVAFVGTAVCCAALAAAAMLRWQAGDPIVLAGCVLYLAGSFASTLRFNVPLNTELARLDPDAPTAAETWVRYVGAWTAWNHVRTVAATLSAAAFIAALAGG